MFRITGGKGFHITFPNGVTVSSQFGAGNYCDNYHESILNEKENPSSSDCEVGIWRTGGVWCTGEAIKAAGLEEEYGSYMVAGHVKIEHWLKLLNAAAGLPSRLTELEYKEEEEQTVRMSADEVPPASAEDLSRLNDAADGPIDLSDIPERR